MKTNVGVIDSAIRIIVALVIIGLYFASVISGTFANVLLVVAVIFLLTGIIKFCPLYLPFGINTWKKK